MPTDRVRTFRLTKIEHAIEIGTKLSHSWFRGHSTIVGSLCPRVFRYPSDLAKRIWGTPHPEPRIIHEFRHFAPVVVEHRLPSDDDGLGWLLHRQHYLTPTRLLDWTESVLIGLFFAVSDNLTEDGELWVRSGTK